MHEPVYEYLKGCYIRGINKGGSNFVRPPFRDFGLFCTYSDPELSMICSQHAEFWLRIGSEYAKIAKWGSNEISVTLINVSEVRAVPVCTNR